MFFYFFSMFVCFIGFTCKCLRQFFCVYIWYTWNPWAHGWLLFWLVGPSLGGLVPPKTSRTRLDLWECHPRIGWCLYQSTRVLRWGGFRVAPTWGAWKQIGGRLSCLLISSKKHMLCRYAENFLVSKKRTWQIILRKPFWYILMIGVLFI